MLKKTGQEKQIRALAMQIAQAKKTIERLEMTKAQLNSVQLSLQEQAAMVKVAGVLSKNVQMMQTMRHVLNGPNVTADLRKLAEEMQHAGIIGELVNESIDDAMPMAEGEVDDVVEGILFEVTAGAIGKPLPTALPGGIGVAAPAQAAAPARVAVAGGPAGAGAGAGAGGDGLGSADFQNRFDNL